MGTLPSPARWLRCWRKPGRGASSPHMLTLTGKLSLDLGIGTRTGCIAMAVGHTEHCKQPPRSTDE
eukprot:3228587-Karenia_brevis.AAC.1